MAAYQQPPPPLHSDSAAGNFSGVLDPFTLEACDERCRTIVEDPKFAIAVANVPDADIDLVIQESDHPVARLGREAVARCLAYMRWAYPMCETCAKSPTDGVSLKKCTRCYLDQYCDKKCQALSWHFHKQRCGNKSGPLAFGPHQLVHFPEKEEDKDSGSATTECRRYHSTGKVWNIRGAA
jgi:hypothetical protein